MSKKRKIKKRKSGNEDINSSTKELPDYLLHKPSKPDNIPHPVRPKLQVLPFNSLPWGYFEFICKDIVEIDHKIRGCNVYGKLGENQKGIDLIAYPKDFKNGRQRVYQCKRVEQFGPSDIRDAVEKFLKAQWNPQPSHFVLCSKKSLISNKCQDEILKQTRKLEKKDIIFDVWDEVKLSKILKDHHRKVYDFFGEGWVKDFIGPEALEALLRQFQLHQVDFPTKQSQMGELLVNKDFDIKSLKSELDRELSKKCDEIREHFREGKQVESIKELKSHIDRFQTGLNKLSPSVRAKFWYILGILSLIIPAEKTNSKKCLETVREIDLSFDTRPLEAMLLSEDKQYEKALEILKPINSQHVFNLTLAMYLDHKKLEKFDDIWNKSEIEHNSVSFQLLACRHRLNRNFVKANEAINNAIKKSPKHPTHYVHAGHIKFWEALPEFFDEKPRIMNPASINPTLFNPTNEQSQLLKEAISYYEKAITLFEEAGEQEKYEVLNIRQFLLLCMAYHPQFQGNAKKLSVSMLNKEPANFTALFYCIEWSVPFDQNRSIKTLETKIISKNFNLNNIYMLLKLYEIKNRTKEAIILLEEKIKSFEEMDAMNVWLEQMMDFQIKAGESIKASEVLEKYSPDDPIKNMRLETMFYDRISDNKKVEEIGTQLYEKSGLMLDLSNLCGFFRKTEQWEKLKKYAQIMTEKQPEPISISFLTYALYKTHNYEDCLAVLEKHSHLFLESKLPEHLDRIRIDCLVRLNRLDVAVPHLEKIVEEKPDPILANYLTHAYIQTGKKEKAALFLKESSDTEWADKNLRLKASQILLVDSPDEAFRIAQKAKEVFPDDPDVWMNFIFTGYHTGHDKEASKSLQTFQRKFPESNYLQLINLDEFIKKNQYWREEREDRWKMYVEAKCPAHFLMDLDRQSLGFDWFIRFHINKSEKWEHKYPLFIQCGSQPFVNEETLKKIPDEIIADYTSLLLAQELNILPLIEKAFSKIIIPPSLLAGIHFEVNKSKEFQISRIHVQQNVKKIIDSGKIRLVSESVDKSVLKDYQVNDIGQDEATLFYFATREKGQVLAKHLLRENEKKYSLNSKLIGIRVFPGEALKSLCELGVLAKDDMNEAASQCVNEPCRDSIVQALLRLPKLFIDTLTIEFFAEFNILEKLTQTFDVSMLKTEAEQINRELTGYEFKNDASSWLNGLHHHISGRLNKNYYFPSIHLDTKNKTPERVCSQIFEESFKIAETMNIPLWMDERYARQYLNINQSPIIGTGEILFKLKSKKIISEKEHYRLIFKLLEMNAQFLPLDPKLVMHFLNVASITSQVKIQEIYELKTIRRYIANVFKKASALNKNSNIEGKQPEAVLYYLQHQRICRDLLEMTWIDKTYSLDRKEAISHWIIKHLWKGPDEITHLLQKKSDQKVAASTLQFLLLFVGFNIIFTDVESLDNVSGYFNWLHSHYFKNNWDLNPEIEKLLFQKTNFFVKQLVFDVEKEDKKSIEIWLRILASVLSNLPVKMLDFLLSEKDINDVFSKYLDRTITISENLKIPSSVWKQWAFESIEKGTGKKLQKNLKNYSFTILWQESSLFLAGLCVDFKSEDDKKFKRTHLEPLIKLFHPNSEIRKQFLNELAPYLKISPEKHKKYEEGFTDENDYKKTAKEIEEEAGSSWAYYWGRTADFVKAQIEMGEDLFFPKNPAIFKNYYSLPNRAFENSSEFSEEWNSFVQKKIEMDGIKKALTDILNFPFGNKIALSELLKTVIREEKEHLKDVIDFVSEKALVSSNPVVLQNCLDILLAFQESGPSEKGEIQSILEKLLNPELCKDISELHSLYDFYVTALQFAWSMMKGNNVFKKYSDKEKIIWVYAYAGAMVDVFDNLRKEHNFIFNHSELSKWFIDRAKEQRKDLFENTYNQFLEVSHPEKSSLVRTVISGTLTIILKHKEKLAWFSKELSGKLLNIAKALPKGEIKGSEEIIKPFKLTKNFYGSFFTGNPLIKIKESIEFFNKEPLESFEDADRNAIEKIKSYDLEMILINTLQKIKNVNPCDILDIMCLNIALSEPVAQSNDKLLKDVVTRLDISKFTKEIDFAFACRVLALCVLASSNEDIKKQAIDKLTISFLKEASEIAHYWAILEAVNLIYSNSNAENPAQEFYKWLDEVISKQQCRIPEELYEVIISLSWQTPLSQQQGLAEVKSKLSLIL